MGLIQKARAPAAIAIVQRTTSGLGGVARSLIERSRISQTNYNREWMATVSELEAAASIVYGSMAATPQQRWPLLDQRCGAEVWVKHENHTPVGAFKVRGGLVYMDDLFRSQPDVPGIVAATRGNHGQSVAFAAGRYGRAVAVVAPFGNSIEKNRAMRALGAELIERGHDFQAALEAAAEIAADRGWHFMPSFHPLLVQGVSSYSLELFRAVPDLAHALRADWPGLRYLRRDCRARRAQPPHPDRRRRLGGCACLRPIARGRPTDLARRRRRGLPMGSPAEHPSPRRWRQSARASSVWSSSRTTR